MNPKTDYGAVRFWFDVGQYVIAVLVAVYVWASNRAKATTKDVKEVKKEVIKIGTRVTTLEAGSITKEDLKNDLKEVYDRINGVAAQVNGMDGKMDGVIRSVDMIHNHLLNKGGKE